MPSDDAIVSALSTAALYALNKKICLLDETVMLVSSFLDPQVHEVLEDICERYGRYSMEQVILGRSTILKIFLGQGMCEKGSANVRR
jgi:hypothetical protein